MRPLISAITLIGAILLHESYANAESIIAIGGPPPQQESASNLPWIVADLGVRTSYITHAGYDPYDTDNALVQLSLSASARVLGKSMDPWSWAFFVGTRYDVGSARATTRSSELVLTQHRVSLNLQASLYPAPWLQVFARVNPGFTVHQASIKDASTSAFPFTTSPIAAALDTSIGVLALIGPHGRRERTVRVWAGPEFGYGWSPATKMSFQVDGSTEDRARFGSISLPELAARGLFFRLQVSAAF